MPKPYIDSGLLFRALNEHKGLVKDLGSYERISSVHAVDAAGLANVAALSKALLAVAPSAEIHSKPLRLALVQLYAVHPEVNGSKFNGETWATLRVERLTVVMNHLRQLARSEDALQKAASQLTPSQYLQLKEVVAHIELREVPPNEWQTSAASQKAGAAVQKADAGLAKAEKEDDSKTTVYEDYPSPAKRKLQPTLSEVSLDSQGFPRMLLTPEDAKACESPMQHEESSSARRKIQCGSSGSTWFTASREDLRKSMGYTDQSGVEEATALTKAEAALPKAAPKKGRIASSKAKASAKAKEKNKVKAQAKQRVAKRPAGQVTPSSEVLKWARLRFVQAKNPPRCYITGTTDVRATKLPLIVEVSATWSSRYVDIGKRILKALNEENITKEEALQMRQSLCERFP